MDYELRIVVEKVAISSQEVSKRDTITSYALQCPTSIVGGVLNVEIDFLRKSTSFCFQIGKTLGFYRHLHI